jgi:hypothetical protein
LTSIISSQTSTRRSSDGRPTCVFSQERILNAYESVKAFSEADEPEDLKNFDVPTFILHAQYDKIDPVNDSACLIKGAKEI